MNKHPNNCFDEQYVTDGADLTGNDCEDTFTFSLAKFGDCHKSEKVNPRTNEKIGISRVTVKCKGNDTLSQKKN